MSNTRSTRNQPFCWQEKKVLRLLRQRFKGAELQKYRNLYLTITEIDSDFNGQDIKFYTKTVSTYSGLSKDWIPQGLKTFEELKLIKIIEDRENGKFKGKRLIFTPELIEEIPQKTVDGKTGNGKTINCKQDTSEDSIYLEDSNIQEDNNNDVDVLSDEQKKYREEVETKKKVIKELLRLNSLNITVEQLVMYSKGDLDRVIRNIKLACNGKYTNPTGALVNAVKGGYDLQVLKDIDEKKDFFTKYKKSISVLEIAYNNGKFDGEQLVWAEQILREEGRL